MKLLQLSAAIALLATGSVLAAPAAAPEASPEKLDAGHFLEKAYVWGSYHRPNGRNEAAKRDT